MLGHWLPQVNLAYVLYQYYLGECPHLGSTLVSAPSCVHGDISPMYSLGIRQGCSLGRDLVIFFRAQMGRTILLPTVPVAMYVAQTA
jgi:hypothetical protein